MIMLLENKNFKRFLGKKIGIETLAGKFVFGILLEDSDLFLKIEFVNKQRVMVVPKSSIISFREMVE